MFTSATTHINRQKGKQHDKHSTIAKRLQQNNRVGAAGRNRL
jgi:hypothetical protein